MNIITSFGIILFTEIDNKKHFLIGQRISSLQYLDIFNSRCPLQKVESYVFKCTAFEKSILARDNINDIYYDSFYGHRDYNELVNRWTKIRPYVRAALKKGINTEQSCMYSFPKGKKKYRETQEEAALREFEEETRIDKSLITKTDYEPCIVYFKGTDDKQYKTVYFIYKCDNPIKIDQIFYDSPFESRQYRVSEEMQELLWVPIDKIQDYLEPYIVKNIENILK